MTRWFTLLIVFNTFFFQTSICDDNEWALFVSDTNFDNGCSTSFAVGPSALSLEQIISRKEYLCISNVNEDSFSNAQAANVDNENSSNNDSSFMTVLKEKVALWEAILISIFVPLIMILLFKLIECLILCGKYDCNKCQKWCILYRFTAEYRYQRRNSPNDNNDSNNDKMDDKTKNSMKMKMKKKLKLKGQNIENNKMKESEKKEKEKEECKQEEKMKLKNEKNNESNIVEIDDSCESQTISNKGDLLEQIDKNKINSAFISDIDKRERQGSCIELSYSEAGLKLLCRETAIV